MTTTTTWALRPNQLLVLLSLPSLASSFDLASWFPKSPALSSGTNVQAIKEDLLTTISNTDNGKSASEETQLRVLQLVRRLETSAPVSDSLLSDPKQAQALNGRWYLQYTSPSVVGDDLQQDAWQPVYAEEGDSNIETKQIHSKGTVNAAGITVDTSNRYATQTIHVKESVVVNQVNLDLCQVTVGGPFRVSKQVPNRAIVAFDRCDIQIANLQLQLGFLFGLLAVLRGSKDSGWLETTYIDSDMRIGRGNKGTMFVLTRDRDAVQV